MKSFYTIIFTPIRPAINEQVSVAMLFIGNNEAFFAYAPEKLSFLNKLIPKDAIDFLRVYLKNFDNKINEVKEKIKSENELIPRTISDFEFLTKEYLMHLSKYSNNLLSYSVPVEIDIEASKENFEIIYRKFISEYSKSEEKTSDSVKEIKSHLYPKIKNRVNTDINIERIKMINKKLSRSILPTVINIIGKNGNYVAGQFIDFDKQDYNLRSDLSFFSNFIHEIGDIEKPFIIGKEPENKNTVQHDYWEEFKENNNFELVSHDRVEIIEKYLKEKDIKPLIQE